jgi:hypothetical protein
VRSLDDLQRVHMLEDAEAQVHLRNLSVHRADTEEAALNLVSPIRSNQPLRITRTSVRACRTNHLLLQRCRIIVPVPTL